MFTTEADVKLLPDIPKPKELHKLALDFMETMGKNWDEQRFSGNMYSQENNLNDVTESYLDEVEKITGQRPENPFYGAWHSMAVEDVLRGLKDEAVKNLYKYDIGYIERQKQHRQTLRENKFFREIKELSKQYPDMPVKNRSDLEADIQKKAADIRMREEWNQEENAVAAFIGTAAGWLSDPAHLTVSAITGYFTGGTGTTLLGTMGRAAVAEGAANAVTEAVSQTKVLPYKQKLGFDYGLKDAAVNVGVAGVFGGTFGAAIPPAKKGLKILVDKVKDLQKKGFKLKPTEQDALTVAERQVDLQEQVKNLSPYPEGSADNMEIEAKIKQKEERLLRPYDAERQALDRAWEDTAAKKFVAAHTVLARISRNDMKDLVFEQGEWKGISGKSGSGYGMVKIVWKHGPQSGDSIPVMKEDILRFPDIVDKYLPILDDDYGETFHWSVKRPDGVQVMYVARETPTSNGAQTIISVHTVNPQKYPNNRWTGIFSPERTTSSRKPVNRLDLENIEKERIYEKMYADFENENNAVGGNMSPTRAMAYETRFQGGNDVIDNNITLKSEKVKNNKTIEYPNTADLKTKLTDNDIMLASEDIDGVMTTKSAREILEDIEKEYGYIDEISKCIDDFGGR